MSDRLHLHYHEFVSITAHGATKDARVVLASENGRSLVVQFDGGLFWPGGEFGYVGTMPLLQQDDGSFIELINQRPVVVVRRDSVTCPRCGMVSFHRRDIDEQYCARCHVFHGDA